jgi:hypothetical protein
METAERSLHRQLGRESLYPSWGMSLFLAELFREQRDRERAPGELHVFEQRFEEEGGTGKALRLGSEPAEGGVELGVPLGRIEVVREAGDAGAFELELSVRVAAGGEDEERAPQRGP